MRDLLGAPNRRVDCSHSLLAKVNAKRESADPWQRLEIDVYVMG
jgi:hypothetical protein